MQQKGRKRRFAEIKQHFFRMGLQKKIVLIVMICFLFTVFCCFGIFWLITENHAARQSRLNVESITREKKDQILDYFNNLDQVAYNICYSNWMQEVFRNGVTAIQRQELENNAREFLRSLSALYGGNQFAVLAFNGTKLNSSEAYRIDYSVDLTQKEWWEGFLEERRMAEIGCGKGIYTQNEEWSVTLYYAVNDNNTLDIVGVMAITIPLKNIKELLESRMDGASFSIMDEEGGVIWEDWPQSGPKIARIMENEADEVTEYPKGYISCWSGLDQGLFSWKLAVTLDENALLVEAGPLSAALYSMIALVAVLLLLMIGAISRYITAPILRCRNAMMEIKHNHLGIMIQNGYQDEIGELIEGFNEMSASISGLIEKNKMMVALQKESEIKMLERQIRPHFLFNTLELINGLILGKKEKAAIMVCGTLGQLYRYHLNQEKWIRIEDELEYIRRYLLIMKYKLEDLEFYSDVEESLAGTFVLKAILQPLVENSVRHGFERKRRECCISVTATDCEDRMWLMVMDNGSGMTNEKLEQIYSEIEKIYADGTGQVPETSHIGIKNVVQRLYLEYGDAMDIRITSTQGHGTKICLTIPKRTCADADGRSYV